MSIDLMKTEEMPMNHIAAIAASRGFAERVDDAVCTAAAREAREP
jgi:hypothetical protein